MYKMFPMDRQTDGSWTDRQTDGEGGSKTHACARCWQHRGNA
jgi:hypothetical protein